MRNTCTLTLAPSPAPFPSLPGPFLAAQPFVDAEHPLQALFPERKWAVLIPTVAFIGAVTMAGTLVGLLMIRSAMGKKKR
jgi:hypothetical protein